MASDSSPPPLPSPGDSSDNRSRRPSEVSRIFSVTDHVTTVTYGAEPPSPAFQFNHDKAKRLFVLTWPDGKTEHFRDNPMRQLVVEPDPVTGELRPAIKNGQPVFVYLCREERETG
jgi:hypothetical protein